MRKRIATVLGATAAALMLTTTAASADTIDHNYPGFLQYTRTCGTSYALSLTSTKAVAGKGTNGSCDGHVWMRVHGDAWGAWTHSNTEVKRTSPSGKFDKAQIKGCSSCTTYNVYP